MLRFFWRPSLVCFTAFVFFLASDLRAACTGTAPVNSTPKDGTRVTPYVTLTWSPASVTPASYVILIETDDKTCVFKSPTTASVDGKVTTYTVASPLAEGTYKWTVYPVGCPTLRSTCTTFIVSCPAVGASPQTPAEGTSVEPGSTSFAWSSASGATQYELFVSENGGAFASKGKTSATQLSVSLTGGATIKWYVVTSFAAGCRTITSSTATFNVLSCPTSATKLTTPSNGATGVLSPVTLQWTAVSRASSYELFLRENSGSFYSKGKTTSTQMNVTFAPGTKVDWYVNTHYSGCLTQTSATNSFTISSGCPVAYLDAPTNDAQIAARSVTFYWKSVAGASDYGLVTRVNSGVWTEDKSGGATSLVKTFNPGSKIEWFVRTYVPGCSTTESEHWIVNTVSSCPTAVAPVLTNPKDGEQNVASPVHFQWNAVAQAVEYEVTISVDGGNPFALARTTDAFLDKSVPAGTIRWSVEAFFGDGCPTARAPIQTFTAASSTCDSPAPIPQSPVGGASVTSPVKFTWTASRDAIGYKVMARTGNDSFASVGSTNGETSLTTALPTGTWEWYVVAFFSTCRDIASSHAFFAVKAGANCNNPAPQLTAPADKATDVPLLVDFKWNEVPNARAYRVFASVNGGATTLVGSTSDDHLLASVAAGSISWFVVAEFDGCPTVQSTARTFTTVQESCNASPATLKSPSSGAQVSSPVTFSWTAVTGAVKYRVWVTIDKGSPVLAAETSSTTATAQLPSGAAVWIVEALFTRCNPVLSDEGRFTITTGSNCPTSAPGLLSPQNGALNVASPVSFSWSAVTGATSYRIFVSVNGQPATEVATTSATSLTARIPTGTIKWFVQAIYPGCRPVSSQIWTFVISQSLTCGQQPPLLQSPADGSTPPGKITFAWTKVPNAVGYRVWVRESGERPLLAAETPNTSVTRVLPSGQYGWWVEALFRGCASLTSQVWTFTAPAATTCPASGPRLLLPVNGATDIETPVSFSWTSVEGAVGYEVWAGRENGDETRIAATESTDITLFIPRGELTWHVEALVPGCDGIESEEYTFTVKEGAECDKPRPLLLSPPDRDGVYESPVLFGWTPVEGATSYDVWISIDGSRLYLLGTATAPRFSAKLPDGRVKWYVDAIIPNCGRIRSPEGEFFVGKPESCEQPDTPTVHAVADISSGVSYPVIWSSVPNSSVYELEESTDAEFTAPSLFSVQGTEKSFSHDVTARTPYFYRVRAISSCSTDRSFYSDVIRVVVSPPAPPANKMIRSAPYGNVEHLTQTILLPGSQGRSGPAATQFTAAPTQPWISVDPASGTIPPEGITLNVTADPSSLDPGTSTGSVIVTTSPSAKNPSVSSGSLAVPVSVSLVAPVTSSPGGAPTPQSLIVPAIGHAEGSNSFWQSDIRVTNVSAQLMRYQLNFTPSAQNGNIVGKQTTVQINPGETIAFDDILASWYGIGSAAESSTGTLEIRPLTSIATGSSSAASSLATSTATIASSRTYNVTSSGTYGQFIPAIPFADFAAKGTTLTLQEIAQSAAFRTNVGVVEASGQSADIEFAAYDSNGTNLLTWNETLQPGEHHQYDRILQTKGLSLTGGRLEVRVTSDTGKITAYASVVDNVTNDPLLVSAMDASRAADTRWVVPGVADLNNPNANWRTDMQIFNAGASPVTATLTFFPQGNPSSPTSKQVTIGARQVQPLPNILQSFFGLTTAGGAVQITTPSSAQLIPTARTYNQTSNGTYGQYIPAITSKDTAKIGGRILQLLQVEQSSRYRTNVGLAEMSGKDATVEVTAILPDTIAALIKTVPLHANEFVQIPLTSLGVTEAYNARVTVRVVGGEGAVTAYASIADQVTQDPTYVPAQ